MASALVSPFPPHVLFALGAFVCAASFVVAGCSGGGSGGGAIQGLSVAESMSVITAPGATGSSATAGSVTPGAIADTDAFDADSDYKTDVQQAYVFDPSMKTLSHVNQILCMVSQTAYSALVNEGSYKALVDEAKCQVGEDGGANSEQGQSSGSNAIAPNVWTVRSVRASNSADQDVELWVPDTEEGNSTIWARMLVHEAATPDNPFGTFSLSFAGVPNGGDLDDAVLFGGLETLDAAAGSIGFSFYEAEGDINVAPAPNESAKVVQANVNMSADQTEGVAYVREQRRENHPPGGDTGIVDHTYAIAFDPDNVLRSEGGQPDVCLSRTDFHANAWNYNLYDATTGERVERNSGFGFRTQNGDYGWVGYYGMWTPPGVDVASGDTVTRDEFGQATSTTYTVLQAPGKLVRNEKQTLDLADLEGETFNWWNFLTNPPVQYRVLYHNTDFQLVATWNESTHEYEDLQNPAVLDTSVFGVLGMYSESLGGPVSFVDGADHIVFWKQTFVNASDSAFGSGSSFTLYGYDQCLRAGITGNQAAMGDVFYGPENDPSMPYEFVFDKDSLTLYSTVAHVQSSPIGLANGETVDSGPFAWGMRTGPLVADTTGFVNVNEAWSADVFYTWETGSNPWNHYSTLIDSLGASVNFDAPLQFRYTHETGNDRNDDTTNNGRTFQLGYDGPGRLHGIPATGIDFDGDGSFDRYYPAFTLKDGVLCGPTGTEYVVKALNLELTLEDALDCSALDTTGVSSLPLPDSTDFILPDNGPAPVVEDAPRVIEGVRQDSTP